MTGHDRGRATSWHAASFMLEVLVLLVFFATAVAVFTALFGQALATSRRTTAQVEAISVAQRTAEEFTLDPESVPAGPTATRAHDGGGELLVSVERSGEERGRGTLWRAVITVRDASGDELYTLTTARYVPDGSTGADGAAEASAAAGAATGTDGDAS